MKNYHNIHIRKFPYPYKAMFAICSDLDETPNRKVYWESARYLNTGENTAMGAGVDLEVGNTIYFNMPKDQFSYWNTDDFGRAMIHNMIQSGHIDCLHSYGDFATHRRHAEKALEALSKNDCKLEIWIDHAIAPTNFGAEIMRGTGDLQNADAYHADLTIAAGVKYVWRGRVTSVIGQNTKRRYLGLLRSSHMLPSMRTIMKEIAKTSLGQFNYPKYSLHKNNNLYRNIVLRDKQPVIEFIRCNPHWGGVSSNDNAQGIADVITRRMLNNLIERNGVSILYTHLGKIKNLDIPFNRRTCKAMEILSEYYHGKKILVASTNRLLNYLVAVQKVDVNIRKKDGHSIIELIYGGSAKDLEGITIYTNDPEKSSLVVNGKQVNNYNVNPPDKNGKSSISIPWKRLEFPDI